MERQPLKRKRQDKDSQASDSSLYSSIHMKANADVSSNCIFDTLSDDMFKICEYLYYDYESHQECFASVSDIEYVYKLSLCVYALSSYMHCLQSL